MVKDAGQIFVVLTREMIDRADPGSAAKVLSDGFVAEHLEITSYELLERVAKAAGDFQTAEVARHNRADEEAMVEKLRAGWDQSVIESLERSSVPPPELAATTGFRGGAC